MNSKLIRLFRPSRIFLIVGLTIWIAFFYINPDVYLCLFHSDKLISNIAMLNLISYTIILALFSRVGEKINWLPRVAGREEINIYSWWLTFGLLICILAYTIWFSLGIYRAHGIINLYLDYKNNAFFVKEVIMKPIAGITSFTQLGVICIPLSLLSKQSSRLRNALMLMIAIMDIIRSIIYSERLALLEIMIPCIIIFMIKKNYKTSLVMRNIIFVVVFVILFFITSEASRSFAARGIFDWGSIFQLGIFRFFGYYLTSVNNYIFAFNELSYSYPFYFTLLPLWSLPGLEGLYTNLTGKDVFDAVGLLSNNNLNPELNVFTMAGYWNMEFGMFGSIVFAAIFGVISGLVFSNSKKSDYWLALYSVWLVGILEFMRIYYMGSPRVTVPLFYFLATILFFRKKSSHRKGEQ